MFRSNSPITIWNPNNRWRFPTQKRCSFVSDLEKWNCFKMHDERIQKCSCNHYVQNQCICVGWLLRQTKTQLNWKVYCERRQMGLIGTNERQKTLFVCVYNWRWVYLCIWRVLWLNWVRNQWYNRSVWSGEKLVVRFKCANEESSMGLFCSGHFEFRNNFDYGICSRRRIVWFNMQRKSNKFYI